jgi:acetoin utilization deacetylase AcuC-like enzyme
MGKHETAVLTSTAFLGHDTEPHVEVPARIAAIHAELDRRELLKGRPDVPFDPAPRDLVERVHDPEYLDWLDKIVEAGGGWIDQDTMCAVDSVAVAMLAAGAAVAGVQAVLQGTVRNAFAIARPPGHHALARRAMGFCLVNSIAVAAEAAIESGCEKVAIVDWDVHHGNGTQAIFYDRADVLFISTHQYGYGFFPGSGSAEEQGTGDGLGTTINLPLEAGAGDADYLRLFDERIGPAIERYDPDLLLISAGFDAHKDDPLGSMRVTDEGFGVLADRVLGWADEVCDGRVVAVLEGGYDQPALGRCVATVLERFDRASDRV